MKEGIFMKLLGLSSAFHFKAQRLALRWAKENLPKEKYQEIHELYPQVGIALARSLLHTNNKQV